MTGLSRRERRAAIRAAKKQAKQQRKAAETRVKAGQWRDFSRGAEQDQGGSQKR